MQGENSRLRKEKREVLQENTTIKQEAHRDMVRAEARLKKEVKALTQKTEGLTTDLAKVTGLHAEVSEERDDLLQHRKHLEARVLEVRLELHDGNVACVRVHLLNPTRCAASASNARLFVRAIESPRSSSQVWQLV